MIYFPVMGWCLAMKYSNENRGKIQDRAQALRINDFSSLRFKNITPTDLDGFIDFKNKKFVLIETKYKDALLPFGQKLALERLCDSSKKDTILMIGTYVSEIGDIDIGGCMLREYRYKRAWKEYPEKITIKEAIKRFLKL